MGDPGGGASARVLRRSTSPIENLKINYVGCLFPFYWGLFLHVGSLFSLFWGPFSSWGMRFFSLHVKNYLDLSPLAKIFAGVYAFVAILEHIFI